MLPLLCTLSKALPVRNNNSDRGDGICQTAALPESCNNELYIDLKHISNSSFPSPQKSNCDNTFHALYFIDENIKTPEKRSTKELQNTPPIDAASFCKSAYFINNGTKVAGIFENEICRFDLEINECDDIRFNQGAMFYRGIDQNGMCFFSQEDDPVQSEPISQLSKPKESIETHIQDDGPISNLTDAAYQIYYHLEHLLNIDYYDEENDY